MSKKTNTEKLAVRAKRKIAKRPRNHPRLKRPNPAKRQKLPTLTPEEMIHGLDLLVFGLAGGLLRSMGISPVKLAMNAMKRKAAQEARLAGTVNSASPDALEEGKAKE